MPSGNGCRANQKRERDMKNKQKQGAKHTADDLKKHEESKNAVQCTICLQGFPRTVREAELQHHMESKHAKAGKTLIEIFPAFTGET
ncbi:hypothetical protein STCU_00946 [Strigomonas culicis]|uniref:Uncharacterized protein n=1 Tax=Strigomonas culicis TaxID=28005 RepID=S9V4B2_9TRYP|nr:hypothetical protein STCU_00946 [Strigomonas culicis]|eukprot:EPY35728.1 hypothetical protein STCU_00946 [Strigomonas culicis]